MNKNLVCIVGLLSVFCSQQLYSTVVWNTGNSQLIHIMSDDFPSYAEMKPDSCYKLSPKDTNFFVILSDKTQPPLTKNNQKISKPGKHDMLLVQGGHFYVDNSVDASTVCKGKYYTRYIL